VFHCYLTATDCPRNFSSFGYVTDVTSLVQPQLMCPHKHGWFHKCMPKEHDTLGGFNTEMDFTD